ncbi:hypothetical protein [uncultured Arthrobacter sp.]|uniref:hypothetical protein n=1 Tax=uncultured Arthrobacter sp. TaxID=114050 RepID=UPI003217B424
MTGNADAFILLQRDAPRVQAPGLAIRVTGGVGRLIEHSACRAFLTGDRCRTACVLRMHEVLGVVNLALIGIELQSGAAAGHAHVGLIQAHAAVGRDRTLCFVIVDAFGVDTPAAAIHHGVAGQDIGLPLLHLGVVGRQLGVFDGAVRQLGYAARLAQGPRAIGVGRRFA